MHDIAKDAHIGSGLRCHHITVIRGDNAISTNDPSSEQQLHDCSSDTVAQVLDCPGRVSSSVAAVTMSYMKIPKALGTEISRTSGIVKRY